MTLPSPTRTHLIGDRRILVYDGLFDESEIGNFAAVVMQLDYARRPSFDRELSAMIDPDLFRGAPFLYPMTEAIHAAQREAFGLHDPSVGLSHVYAAAIGPDACGTVHTDTSDPEAMTFLYYANAGWRAGWAGETVFYDDAGDAQVVVAPRPGRLAVFHSNVLHRAGIPHPDTPTYRYTVSVFYYPERARARPS